VSPAPSPSRQRAAHPAVHALFQRRLEGDDALLRLANLRFAQAGLAAEVYADTPEQLQHVLGFVSPHPHLPLVHLNRSVNLLHERDRSLVQEFATRFRGRVSGLVVHDQRDMATRVPELMAGLRELDGRPAAPYVFLEYAAGLEPDLFIDIAQRMGEIERVSVCIDVGHVGIRQARMHFRNRHPDLDLAALHPEDPRLPSLAADVQAAVDSALPTVLEMSRALGRIGKRVHFHLHDGHPVIPGLSDHFSFLTQIAVPFEHRGRRSLDPMYGPGGLAAIVAAMIEALGGERASLTLEIHQSEGRLPIGDAAPLFRHWQDLKNAERMNYWLSVLAQNNVLVLNVIEPRPGR
jgi:hypothetical protein